MNSFLGIWHRLAPRGGNGLACDKDGVALGPVALVTAQKFANGKTHYRLRPSKELDDIFALAYGPKPPGTFARWHEGLNRVAKALDQGQAALTAISAVQLGLPEIAPERMEKLAHSSLTNLSPSPTTPTSRACLPATLPAVNGPAMARTVRRRMRAAMCRAPLLPR